VRGQGREGRRKSRKKTDRQMEKIENERVKERKRDLLFIVKDILSKFLLFVWLIFNLI
jgi:hypothetical protein